MKNEIKRVVVPVVSAAVIAFATGYLICHSLPSSRQNRQDSVAMGIVEKDTARSTAEGDPGLSDEELRSPVSRDEKARTRKEFVKLALEGVGNIPFLEGGHFLEGRFPKFPDGLDNRVLEKGFQTGVDSLGYVQWLYNQMFQVVIEDPAEEFRQGNRIAVSELRAGDIAMKDYHVGAANHYGIFLGYDGDIPVIIHCDSGPWPRFPGGVVKLSTIEEEGHYYMGTSPEAFSYFTRPAVVWEDENSTDNNITDLMQEYHTVEMAALNQCGEYGIMLFHEIMEKNKSELLELLNAEVVQKRGFNLDSEKYIKKLESLTRNYAGKRIMVYNISELPDSGAIVARFCFAEEKKGVDDEVIYDSMHCQWQDITFYLNDSGEMTGYLPCHEAMIAYAAEYGFVKE